MDGSPYLVSMRNICCAALVAGAVLYQQLYQIGYGTQHVPRRRYVKLANCIQLATANVSFLGEVASTLPNRNEHMNWDERIEHERIVILINVRSMGGIFVPNWVANRTSDGDVVPSPQCSANGSRC
jgi:hypothetical protein